MNLEKRMDKTEFLNQLRASLNGKMDAEEVADNLRYYEEYINGQLRLGRTESEVMTSLGSPRLIARSIMDATNVKEQYENAADRSSEWQQGAWQQADQQAAWQQNERQGTWQQADWKEDDRRSGWQRAGWRQPKTHMDPDAYRQEDFHTRTNIPWLAKFFTLPKWIRMTIGFAALAAFMIVLCWILKFLFPIIMLGMISLFLVKLFRDWLN